MLHQATCATDGIGNRHRIAAIQDQCAVIGHSPSTQRTCGATCTDLQRAAIDGGCALIAVIACQHHGASSCLRQPTCTLNRAVHRQCCTCIRAKAATGCAQGYLALGACAGGRLQGAAIEAQCTAGCTQSGICIDLQRATIDGRAALVGVVTQQYGGASALLQQATRATDIVGNRAGVTAIKGQRAIVDDRACAQIACGAAIAQLHRAAADGGGAGIAVGARQNQGASAILRQ